MRTSSPVTAEFINARCRVDNSGCILWCGYVTKAGYGCIFRTHSGVRTWVYVHRFVYEQANGPIPAGMAVCHTCDTPNCCNPSHLFLGTDKDNSDDKIRKGRHAHGSRHGVAKLTESDVLEIRKMAAQKVPLREIAKMFGISHWTAGDAARGDSWKHVPISKENHANI